MNKSTAQNLTLVEFVLLMALLISLIALSIDAMLPALSNIGKDLGVERINDSQFVISVLFLGLAVGQLFYGPLSDSIGRKPAIYAGLGLFVIGCILSIVSQNLTLMLVGRFLQGLGAAGPRIVTVALVRDLYEGRAMARIMSLVMTTFVFVPAFAPALGQGIIFISHWRMIFVLFLVLAIIAGTWFGFRQHETLPASQHQRFSLRQIALSAREVLANRFAFGYSIATGLVFAPFIGYLTSAQQILQEQFGLGTQFPLYFAVLALSVGAASFANAKLVLQYGMRLLSWRAVQVLSIASIAYFGVAVFFAGTPPLWTLMVWGIVSFFCIGMLFANFNAMAMEPLGHIAGVGAAVIGSMTMFISLIFGTWIGQMYNGTILPLVGGFALMGVATLLVMYWTESTSQSA